MSVVFVYGTLMRGESNHYLLKSSKFLGEVKTGPQYDLFNLGYFPAMVKGGYAAISGELYEVGPETIKRLDILEGHPDFYQRIKIEIDGREVETYVLARARVEKYQIITSGFWKCREV